MRASEPFEPSSIWEKVRGSRLVLGRRFGRRFVFGRLWSLFGVVWGVVLAVVSILVVFGRFWASYVCILVIGLVAIGLMRAIDRDLLDASVADMFSTV